MLSPVQYIDLTRQFEDAEERLVGHRAMQQQQATLAELAERSGAAGSLDHLGFFQSNPYFGSKQPNALIFKQGDRPVAAVLVHEYRAGRFPLRLFVPEDASGERTVIAVPADRLPVAMRAAESLLRSGGLAVLLSFACGESDEVIRETATRRGQLFAFRRRTVLRDLLLKPTLDETLGQMGAHTRRNLRACRRQADRAGLEYLASASIEADEFQTLNERCAYPVPQHVGLWRLRTAREPGGFIGGLRQDDGAWVSLVGGRRYMGSQGPMTVIDWQMNRTDVQNASLVTTMRAFVLENEIARGTCRLRFEGGTPHSMRSAFLPESVVDLVFAPRWFGAPALRALGGKLRAGNLLGETLRADDLEWIE